MFRPGLFLNRADAGERLAAELERCRESSPVVLALPRGGVVVGAEVARALAAPLQVLVARKLGAPWEPELAIGAIAPGGVCVLDDVTIRTLGITPEAIARVTSVETAEMERRQRRYCVGTPLELRDRTVILVDDGLATGLTARAAIQALRVQGVERLVLAVPVSSAEAAAELGAEVDDLVALAVPPHFGGVGLWYDDFRQVSDEEVLQLLEANRH